MATRKRLAAVVRRVPSKAVDALGSLVGTLAHRRQEQLVGPITELPVTVAPAPPPETAAAGPATAGGAPAIELATACRANLSLVVDACERAGIEYFAVIEPAARGGRLGVADHDWGRLADAIAVAGLHEPVAVDCWDADTGRRRARTSSDLHLRQAMLRTKRLLVFRSYPVEGTETVLGRPYGCAIERWSVDEDGTLTSPTVNEIVQVIGPEDRRPVRTEVLGREVMTYPPFTTGNALAVDFPIDVVVPWIDDSDPARCARRLQELAGQDSPDCGERRASQPRPPSDPDLLRYTLRSLRDNLPWIRTVHLVTDGPAPPWLDPDDPTVRVVDVNDLLQPRGAVPTFNPGAVRAVLHHLDGLAEHYLLIESGTVIKRHLRPTDFFFGNGVVRLSFARQTLPLTNAAASPIDVSTRLNVVELLHREFGRHPAKTFAPGHSVQRRSILTELEDRFPDAFKRTWCSQFPASTDFEVSGWLHNYYAYFTGRGTAAGLRCEQVDPRRGNVRGRLRDLGRGRVDTVSFGDGRAAPAAARALVESTLRRWFPVPAGHERYASESVTPDRSWA